MLICACVVAGTGIAYAASSASSKGYRTSVSSSIVLRASYAMPGTDLAYQSASSYAKTASVGSQPACSKYQRPTLLRMPYAAPGTDICYAAKRRSHLSSSSPSTATLWSARFRDVPK
eukprot:1092898-Rhodomonas_salina.1